VAEPASPTRETGAPEGRVDRFVGQREDELGAGTTGTAGTTGRRYTGVDRDEGFEEVDIESLRRHRAATTREISRLRRDLTAIHDEVADKMKDAQIRRKKAEERIMYLKRQHDTLVSAYQSRGILNPSGEDLPDEPTPPQSALSAENAGRGTSRGLFDEEQGERTSPTPTRHHAAPRASSAPPPRRLFTSQDDEYGSGGVELGPDNHPARGIPAPVTNLPQAAPLEPRSRQTTDETAVQRIPPQGQLGRDQTTPRANGSLQYTPYQPGPELVLPSRRGTTVIGLRPGKIDEILREKEAKHGRRDGYQGSGGGQSDAGVGRSKTVVEMPWSVAPERKQLYLDAYGADKFVPEQKKMAVKEGNLSGEERKQLYFDAFGADRHVKW